MIGVLGLALLSFLLSLVLTPVAGMLAKKLNILDHPDQHLKQHKQPVPYLGGLAVFVSFMISLVVIKFWQTSTLFGVVGVVSGTSLVTALGLIDDKKRLSWQIKFLGQILAAGVLVFCHMRIQIIDQPIVSVVLTVLWVVGITNALNLIDVMDGLCAGVSIIACAVFLIIGAQNNLMNDMFILAALSGAVLGFLPYNFPKARIYLGDTGALLLGFILSSIAMGENYDRTNSLAVLAPIFILGVPIFDTLFIMFLRHRRGVSMFRGSPDHLALRMVKLGLTKTQTVLLLWAASLILGLVALASIHVSMQWAMLIYVALAGVALFVAERMGSFSMEPNK